MARIEVIRRRLQRLDEYVAILKGLQHYSFAAFVEDPERYGSAERFLQLAIETLTDMGSHVIAQLSLGTVESYRDIPFILAEHGYIDRALSEKWIQMIGFRNILVHDYLDLDREIVYRVLQEGLEDIAALRRSFAQFL
jgi:uncharacterized protein YutE (UPF0331/DUF86 family)